MFDHINNEKHTTIIWPTSKRSSTERLACYKHLLINLPLVFGQIWHIGLLLLPENTRSIQHCSSVCLNQLQQEYADKTYRIIIFQVKTYFIKTYTVSSPSSSNPTDQNLLPNPIVAHSQAYLIKTCHFSKPNTRSQNLSSAEPTGALQCVWSEAVT